MWSGNDRDDSIVDATKLNSYPFRYDYTNSVSAGITGGAHDRNNGNIDKELANSIKQVKSLESRSIENYIHIVGLHHYLTNLNFKFIFLEYRDFSLPATDLNFDIRNFLPNNLVKKLNQINKIN